MEVMCQYHNKCQCYNCFHWHPHEPSSVPGDNEFDDRDCLISAYCKEVDMETKCVPFTIN